MMVSWITRDRESYGCFVFKVTYGKQFVNSKPPFTIFIEERYTV